MTEAELVKVEAEERQLVENIVSGWNKIVNNFENQTIAFVKVVQKYLAERPQDSVTRIMKEVYRHPQIKRTISTRRVWQGLRLAKNRPDLIAYHDSPQSSVQVLHKFYTKDNGEIFWEFYFELYKYQLSEDTRANLETQGINEKWTTAFLRYKIHEIKLNSTAPLDVELEKRKALISAMGHLLVGLDESGIKKVREYVNQVRKEQRAERDAI